MGEGTCQYPLAYPVFCSLGFPRARKELETFDLDCKAIHFVSN